MIHNMVGGGGGGGGLNFAVKGYPSADAIPEVAKENTIAVITDVEITSYIFSATEPENPVEGMVWVSTGSSSPVSFNALKHNTLMVYPSAVKQYIDGAWVNKDKKTYTGGSWTNWFDGWLFDSGNTFDSITGGWTNHEGGSYLEGWAYVYASFGEARRTVNKINLTGFNYLNVQYLTRTGTNTIAIDESDTLGKAADLTAYESSEKTGVVSLDISAYDGDYYIYVVAGVHKTEGGYTTYTADKVWLSK